MDTFQMNPKAICAEKAVHHPHDMQALHRTHNVKRLPTVPNTTWPNRAEMGVETTSAPQPRFGCYFVLSV